MMSGNLIAPLGPPSATPLRPAAAAACSGPVAERNISLEITFEGEPHSKYKGMYKDVKNEMETASEPTHVSLKRNSCLTMVLRASDPLPAGPIFIETFYFNQAFEGEVLEPCEKHASRTTKNVLQLWNPGSDSSVMQVEKDGQKHISVMVEDGSMQTELKIKFICSAGDGKGSDKRRHLWKVRAFGSNGGCMAFGEVVVKVRAEIKYPAELSATFATYAASRTQDAANAKRQKLQCPRSYRSNSPVPSTSSVCSQEIAPSVSSSILESAASMSGAAAGSAGGGDIAVAQLSDMLFTSNAASATAIPPAAAPQPFPMQAPGMGGAFSRDSSFSSLAAPPSATESDCESDVSGRGGPGGEESFLQKQYLAECANIDRLFQERMRQVGAEWAQAKIEAQKRYHMRLDALSRR